MSGLTSRRQFLMRSSAAALGATAGWALPAAAQSAGPEQFAALSEKITNVSDLSADIASAMLEAFRKTDHADALTRLLEGGAEPDEVAPELAHDITAAWYTGVSPDPEALEVLTYTDALLWQALDYTKPMAYCGGSMGYWAEPPA